MKLTRIKFGLVAFALLLVSNCGACRKSAKPANANAIDIQTTPPFVAKEPAQYRATRFTTSTGADGTPITQQIGVGRDGDRARLDFTRDGKPVTLLETPAGRFLVSAGRGVFARLQPGDASPEPSDEAALVPDLSTTRLLNQDDLRTEYRRLRADQLSGRAVTVYQVTIRAGEDETESLLWVDDETSFPLRNELAEISGGVRQPTGFVTEIRDLVLGPPPAGWFDIPASYREVPVAEF